MPIFAEVTASTATNTVWIPMDQYAVPFNVGFGVRVSAAASAGTTTDFSVQHTFHDVFAESSVAAAKIFDHSDVSGKSGNIDGNYAFPVAAIRLEVSAIETSAGSGAVVLSVRQATNGR